MAHLSDFATYRNGGIEFTASGTAIDGRVAILSPKFPPLMITRDGTPIPPGAPENGEVERLLENWFRERLTPQAKADLEELDSMREWRDLPSRLDEAVLLHRVRWVIERLRSESETRG